MTDYQVTASVTALRASPSENAPMDSQLLHGEVFSVEKEENGWAYGTARRDDYSGWVSLSALEEPVLISTHRVSALRTYAFSEPDLKSRPRAIVSLNAKVASAQRKGKFIDCQRLGWIFETHLAVLGAAESDYVAVAERFLYTPYLWGGRESIGLDCSGLVQTALEAAGVRGFPRDTKEQEAWAKTRWNTLDISDDLAGLQRGDLIFWPGHVGIMTDSRSLLHANAHHMATVVEPLATAAKRIAHKSSPISAICRPPVETGWTGMM
ncbi:C40 family peptidase [Marinicauda sp. Alg238-R41]|uniref:C40 family peptidase n=1 Tax=Marinicauda sp. Alg238-R41 TaxID=2993447 RepID=UPI0022DEFF08|nr:NlpC/P60 family protein [Marinicauda sp. Alg238-R41]